MHRSAAAPTVLGSTRSTQFTYAYLDASQTGVGYFVEPKLAATTERHKIDLLRPVLKGVNDPFRVVLDAGVGGIVVGMCRGWPGLPNLRLAHRVLNENLRVWFDWPGEEVVECIDRERLRSYWLLWTFITPLHYLLTPVLETFTKAIRFLATNPHLGRQLGRNAQRAISSYSWDTQVRRVRQALQSRGMDPGESASAVSYKVQTSDEYKNQTQDQWNGNPCGAQYAQNSEAETLSWFREIETHRYEEYAPWMPEIMEFSQHAGERILEIGGGLGTDLVQFAKNGGHVTNVDLSKKHLELAKKNFELRGLKGTFIHGDAEDLPLENNTFDLVYSHGVLHHTPNAKTLINEIGRVLKPGGRVIVMVYAENSWHYWVQIVLRRGVIGGLLRCHSVGEIMSRHVEFTETGSRPLVKVYSRTRLRQMFARFDNVQIVKRQMTAAEIPLSLRWIPLNFAAQLLGWNLIVKATKPANT